MNQHQQRAAQQRAAELIEEAAAAVLAHPQALHTVAILISALAEAEQTDCLSAALRYTLPTANATAEAITALLN